jgi:hypothetical protein
MLPALRLRSAGLLVAGLVLTGLNACSRPFVSPIVPAPHRDQIPVAYDVT